MLNVSAIFDESYAILDSYVDFSSSLRATYESHTKEVKKRAKRVGAFVEPPISLPEPPTIDNSLLTQDPHEQTPPGAGRRPARGAALRARHGVAASYKLMSQTKLRRPSNFDPNRGFQPMPTIPATPSDYNNDDGLRAASSSSRIIPPPLATVDEDVFRRPAPPPGRPARSTSRSDRSSRSTSRSDRPSRATSKSNHPSRSTRASEDLPTVHVPNLTFNVSTDDTDSESKGVRRSKRARASKKKRKNTKKEPKGADADSSALNDDTKSIEPSEPAEPMDVEPPQKTLTKTLGENQPETASTSAAPDTDSLAVELIGSDAAKTRTKTLKKIKPEAASTSTLLNVDDKESLAVESVGTDASRTRTRTLRKNKPEAPSTSTLLNVDDKESVAVESVDTDATKTRTKTLRKNKLEAPSSYTLLNVDDKESVAVESVDTDAAKTRTKTLRRNKPTASTSTLLNVDDKESLAVEPMDTDSARTRTKTLGKNKPVEESLKLESTYYSMASTADDQPEGAIVPKAPFRAKRKSPKPNDPGDFKNTVSCIEAADAAAVEMSRPSRRSVSCPRNGTITMPSTTSVKVMDPMDTLDLPEGMECFTAQGSNKRQHNPSNDCDIPGVKRRKSSDNTIEELLVVQNAPRTRSKIKAIAESRSRSEETKRTPGNGKENAGGFPLNFVLGNYASPLVTHNKIRLSPKSKTNESAARNKPARFVKEPTKEVEKEKAKMAEARRKEEEALKKKQELMMLKKQEIRTQRETKIKKVTESRAAVEKEKLLQLEKEKKEREEKEKQAKAELMRQKEEALMKKKLLNQQKAQEAEERRQKEEQMRLARLREQEEEQRKATEARQRQVEEAERLAALRKLQQKEEEQARQLEKIKEKAKPAKAVKDETFDPDNYGIVDDDGDEQEAKPRRPIPKWAEKEGRTSRLNVQTKVVPALIREFFNVEACPPSLREIFGREALIRPRTSSAVWATPPPPPPSSS